MIAPRPGMTMKNDWLNKFYDDVCLIIQPLVDTQKSEAVDDWFFIIPDAIMIYLIPLK